MSSFLEWIKFIPYVIPFLLIPLVALSKVRSYLKRDIRQGRRRLLTATKPLVDNHPPFIIGYFHPYCNAGGGGERVLWTMIQSLQAKHPYILHAIYTGDVDVSKETMLENVKNRFNIDIDPDTVDLIYLKTRSWVEASKYPRFTMLGQSLGSMVLGWEAMSQLIPDIFFDTMGYAFTYPIVKGLAECRVAAYVHYPTISTDMLASVKSRDTAVNNSGVVASSPLLSQLKICYYRIFAVLYGAVGSLADVVMVNSTWTQGHIRELWGSQKADIVFPPCDTHALTSLSVEGRKPHIISVAQFRPEKNHKLQLHALAELFRTHPEYRCQKEAVELIVLGSVRDSFDQTRVDELVLLAKHLEIQDSVRFVVNASYSSLLEHLQSSLIGLHTMANEHFGIGVVELMAAGLIPIAHDSAGPKMDIISATHNDQGKFILIHA
ncbi:asparagine-linked glycosylation protein, variant 3 [Entomophthora muscae]|uniref:Asparagine-linked glycosylation protein, variant 3 n=1 Tax=Entomophthora muscae TaxID=34485 RepID=A0ACC2S111_9FUNG|nr:asparagine-linked glycosylation protein, variant 3 [Entomophthora muscae]